MRTLLSFFILFSLLVSCKKEVAEVNTDFIGDWRSSGGSMNNSFKALLEIKEDSKGKYSWIEMSGEEKENFSGIVRIKNDKLKINTVRFRILEFPTKIDYNTGKDTVIIPYFSEDDAFGKPKYATWEMEIRSLTKFAPKHIVKFYR